MRTPRLLTVFVLAASMLTGCGSETSTASAPPPPPAPPVPGTGTANVAMSILIGGSEGDAVRDITTDAAGNIYLTGGTSSPDFPVTPGAAQTSFSSGTPMEVFVTKLSPTGQLLWATFIGGPGHDRAYAIEVDAQGFVVVAGRASSGFPVTSGAFQTGFRGGVSQLYGAQDGFVCKITPDGSAFVFCSYMGTDDTGFIRDVDVDRAGDIYVAANATNPGLPASWFSGSYQSSRRGGRDVVVARIRSDGSEVVWATYLGGSANEGGENSLRLDPAGDVVVLTHTESSDIPSPGGFDATLGGPSDIYVAKLSPDGRALRFGSHIGGSDIEFTETHELAVDPQGNIYVAAKTNSQDFPTTPGAYQRTHAGVGGTGTGLRTNYPGDVFVTKLSPSGALIASTLLGGRYGEGAEGVGVDAEGNVYFTGGTYSYDFPVTGEPYGPGGGELDAFASALSADLTELIYSIRIGASDMDLGRSATVMPDGTFFIGGGTRSSDWPTTGGPALRGPVDGVVVKLAPSN